MKLLVGYWTSKNIKNIDKEQLQQQIHQAKCELTAKSEEKDKLSKDRA